MINVIDDAGNVIARVNETQNLDYWDGHNMTNGGTGLHRGITRLKKSGKYVLIHITQWQGESDWAEIISPEQALQEIMKGNESLLDEERFSELKKMSTELETD